MKKNRHSESTLWCSVMLCALCSLQSRFVGCNDVQEEHHAPDAPKTPLSWCKIHRTSAKKSTELLASTQNSRSEDNLETQATLKRRNHRRKENKRKNKRKSDEIDMDWHGLTWIDMDWQRRFLSIATDVATHSNRLLHVSFVEGNGCAIRSKFRSVKQLLSLNLNSSHAFDAFEIHLLPGSFTMGKQTDKTDVCIGLFWQRDSNACCASLKYHAYIQEEWVDTVSFGSLAQWAQHPLRSGI